MINANPDTGVYIVSETGHIYSWVKNASSAIDLGVYQAAENSDMVNLLNENIQKIIEPIEYTENIGYYFAEDGSLVADTGATQCVYTEKISVYEKQVIDWEYGRFQWPHYLWGAYMLYDSKGVRIGKREVFINTSSEGEVREKNGSIVIPEGVSQIAFCWRSFGERRKLKIIKYYNNNSIYSLIEKDNEIIKDFNEEVIFNESLLNNKYNKIMTQGLYIRYNDGDKIGTGGYLRLYSFKNPTFKHIKTFVYGIDTLAAAIAFYSDTTINVDNYMKSTSVQFQTNSINGKWHEADVPEGCKLVVITTRTDATDANPLVEFRNHDKVSILETNINDTLDEINGINLETRYLDKKIQSLNDGVLKDWKYIYHFGMSAVAYRDVPVEIPSQSIYDESKACVGKINCNNILLAGGQFVSAFYFRIYTRSSYSGNVYVSPIGRTEGHYDYYINETKYVKEERVKNLNKYAKKSEIPSFPKSKLDGKVIVNFGDSMFGNFRDSTSISSQLAEITGATVYNCGFGGCQMANRGTGQTAVAWSAFSMYALADAICSGDFSYQEENKNYGTTSGNTIPSYFASETLPRLESIDFDKVDIITIAYGTNDYTAGQVIDDTNTGFDVTTYIGAFKYSIKKIQQTYPKIKILVITPIWRYWSDTEDSDVKDYGYGTLKEIKDKLVNASKSMRIPCLDSYENLSLSLYNALYYFETNDKTHINSRGRRAYAELIDGALEILF